MLLLVGAMCKQFNGAASCCFVLVVSCVGCSVQASAGWKENMAADRARLEAEEAQARARAGVGSGMEVWSTLLLLIIVADCWLLADWQCIAETRRLQKEAEAVAPACKLCDETGFWLTTSAAGFTTAG